MDGHHRPGKGNRTVTKYDCDGFAVFIDLLHQADPAQERDEVPSPVLVMSCDSHDDVVVIVECLLDDSYMAPVECKSITIVEVDDKKLGLTGTFSENAWKKWCAELFANAMANPWLPGTTYTWYTGEQSYVDKIEKLYPGLNFVIF